jgi:hypothetical protein
MSNVPQTAAEMFEQKISENMAKGMKRQKAVSQAVKQNPRLHEQLLQEANAGRKLHRPVA